MIDLHLSAFAPRWRFLYAVRIDAYKEEWSLLTYEEKNRLLFLRQKKTLDMFLECILRHTAAVSAVVQRPLCGLSSGRN